MQSPGGTDDDDWGSPEHKFIQPVTEIQELPKSLKELYSVDNVKSCNDAFVLVLHAFMLEVGFIPKDVPESEKLKMLPENWHSTGVYKIIYFHSTCPEISCLMTCVPLDQILSVFGTVDDVSPFQQTTLCLQVKRYVNHDIGFADPSVFFCKIRDLSRDFKDQFAYALLASMQDALGFGPTFGLAVMMDDIKLQILSRLSVGSLLKTSCVSKEFFALCNTPLLWKNLYMRDFPVALVDSEDVKQGWKELYKQMYLKQLKQRKLQYFVVPSLHPGFEFPDPVWYPSTNPHPPGIGPPFEIGIPPEIGGAFPQLQQRVVIHQPFVPRNPSLNIPGIFRFF